jgi:hypothetical protein
MPNFQATASAIQIGTARNAISSALPDSSTQPASMVRRPKLLATGNQNATNLQDDPDVIGKLNNPHP